MSSGLNPAVKWARTISLWLFVFTTWGVALFFLVDFWPVIRQLTLFQVLLCLTAMAVFATGAFFLWIGNIVTLGQIFKFLLVMFFFIAMAVLYSYVGLKLGLFIRDLFDLETMSRALG